MHDAGRGSLIAGAAGRDFHNFNVVYRGRDEYEVVAFTATQIPDIDGPRLPARAGRRRSTPTGSRSIPEAELEELSREHDVDEVVFAYSDVTHEHVMHVGSRALAAGRRLTGCSRRATTMLASTKPVRRDLRRAHRLRQEPDDAARRRSSSARPASASPSSGTRCPTAT